MGYPINETDSELIQLENEKAIFNDSIFDLRQDTHSLIVCLI